MDSLLVKAEEAARLLQLSRSKVYAMLQSGELPSIRIGRSVRISQESLKAWVTDRSGGAPVAADAPYPTAKVVDLQAAFRKAGFEKPGLPLTAEKVTPALRRLAEAFRQADALTRRLVREEAVRRLTKGGVRAPRELVELAFKDVAAPVADRKPRVVLASRRSRGGNI